MTNALVVSDLGKRFAIGRQLRHRTARDRIAAAAAAPFQRVASAMRGRPANHARQQELWALRHVDFEVSDGEVVGVIGRNGAGKSTLLKVLSRITEPTEGFAEIRGRVGALLEVGTGFNPELTGRENIFLNAAILGMRRAEINRKFDEMVQFAEVEQFIDTPVKHYSSGMALRLGFSVAAHLEPDILIVDEVLAVGDASFQQKCLGKMRDVSGDGRTVLFVSHNMAAVSTLCSRGIWLEGGTVKADGPAHEVVSQYTAAALGAGVRRTWDDDAAAGDGFVLRSVEIVDDAGEHPSVLDVERSYRVRIGYTTTQPDLSCRIAVIFRVEGVVAFAAVQPAERVHTLPGDYGASVEIPADLLTEAEHLVDLSVYSSRGRKSHFVQVKEALSFQTFDAMRGSSARGDYAERIAGVVRPKLRWSVEEPASTRSEPV